MTKKIYVTDPWLEPFRGAVDARHERILADRKKLAGDGTLSAAVNNHIYYPLHREGDSWVIREWAPNATRIFLIGESNNWKRTEGYAFRFLHHGELYKLWVEWPGGGGERLPAYVTRVVQDPETKIFSAQVWDPEPYEWKHRRPGKRPHPLIYECHRG